MKAREGAHLLYVTKLPPSTSGVARYASRFLEVLRGIGDVRVVVTGHDARDTTRVGRIVSVVHSVSHELRRRPDWVVVELSGRAIAELVASAYILSRRRRPRVWITIHDTPAVSGGVFWVAILDRKGLRRVAALLSRTVGRRIETWVLNHSDVVACLSKAGTAALAQEFDLVRPLTTIHPVGPGAHEECLRDFIFVPGPTQAIPTAEVLAAIAETTALKVVLGYSDAATHQSLSGVVADLGMQDRVRFTGAVSQEALTLLYAESLVVIFWRAVNPDAASNSAACSYPVVDAMASGAVLITNTARGAREYVAENVAAFDLTERPGDLRSVIGEVCSSTVGAAALGRGSREYASERFATAAVLQEVSAILSDELAAPPYHPG